MSSIPNKIPATNSAATSYTSIASLPITETTAALSQLGATGLATAGFGTLLSVNNISFNDPSTRKNSVMTEDFVKATTDIMYEKNMTGVSTVTLQMNDPYRLILRNFLQQGTELVLEDNGRKSYFALSQYMKAGDQVQFVFESMTIYRLRNQRNPKGTVTTTTGTGVTEFMASLVSALNYQSTPYNHVSFVGPDYATIWSQLTGNAKKPIVKVGLGRGTKTDPFEDSWTCMTRLASSVGWRLWENNDTIYFGPDEYWLGLLTKSAGLSVPPINSAMGTLKPIPQLQEFTEIIQDIDFDWDVQKPFAQATVTAMLDKWTYDIGEVVELVGLGPGDGAWLVYGMQRDAFQPQATLTLQVPMPFATVFDPTSLPLPAFPLITKLL